MHVVLIQPYKANTIFNFINIFSFMLFEARSRPQASISPPAVRLNEVNTFVKVNKGISYRQW